MSNLIRRGAIFVFAFVMVVGTSSAALAAPVGRSLLSRSVTQTWAFLGQAFGWEGKLRCGIDPDGVWYCQPNPAEEIRCGIDPNGAPCEPQSSLKIRCGIDPDGKPFCSP